MIYILLVDLNYLKLYLVVNITRFTKTNLLLYWGWKDFSLVRTDHVWDTIIAHNQPTYSLSAVAEYTTESFSRRDVNLSPSNQYGLDWTLLSSLYFTIGNHLVFGWYFTNWKIINISTATHEYTNSSVTNTPT
jgi:hypothetical protein